MPFVPSLHRWQFFFFAPIRMHARFSCSHYNIDIRHILTRFGVYINVALACSTRRSQWNIFYCANYRDTDLPSHVASARIGCAVEIRLNATTINYSHSGRWMRAFTWFSTVHLLDSIHFVGFFFFSSTLFLGLLPPFLFSLWRFRWADVVYFRIKIVCVVMRTVN